MLVTCDFISLQVRTDRKATVQGTVGYVRGASRNLHNIVPVTLPAEFTLNAAVRVTVNAHLEFSADRT
jgi:hypothetical protein